MSEVDTSQTVVFADYAGRRRRFCLRLGEIEDLERLAGAGIGTIMLRVASQNFYVADIYETIRLGLEGGGMEEPMASALVQRSHGRPLIEHAGLAALILQAAVSGVPAEPGKQTEERTDDPATSPPSSPPGPPSDDPPETSGP